MDQQHLEELTFTEAVKYLIREDEPIGLAGCRLEDRFAEKGYSIPDARAVKIAAFRKQLGDMEIGNGDKRLPSLGTAARWLHAAIDYSCLVPCRVKESNQNLYTLLTSYLSDQSAFRIPWEYPP